jgi:hypothetical protein
MLRAERIGPGGTVEGRDAVRAAAALWVDWRREVYQARPDRQSGGRKA